VAIPTFEEAMLPMLQVLADGQPRSAKELRKHVIDTFGVTPEEQSARIPSDRVPIIQSRCGWAIFHLHKAGFVQRPSRAIYVITEKGCAALKSPDTAHQLHASIKLTTAAPQPGSVPVKIVKPGDTTPLNGLETSEKTPEELIAEGYQFIRQALAQELLDRVHQKDPGFFERLVVDLLVAMGYGGAYGEAIQAMGQTGDGGIDGIIKEDRLGLDFIYVQAKRWQNTVGRPELQQFAGSLMGRKAAKGVFITTSGFSQTAKDFVASIQTRIVLVDGEMLANLMIDHGVGVSDQQVIHIRKLDEDYFEES
jgi:restriction system protein